MLIGEFLVLLAEFRRQLGQRRSVDRGLNDVAVVVFTEPSPRPSFAPGTILATTRVDKPTRKPSDNGTFSTPDCSKQAGTVSSLVSFQKFLKGLNAFSSDSIRSLRRCSTTNARAVEIAPPLTATAISFSSCGNSASMAAICLAIAAPEGSALTIVLGRTLGVVAPPEPVEREFETVFAGTVFLAAAFAMVVFSYVVDGVGH